MDWELKTLSWDFTDIAADDDHGPHLAALVGLNSLNPNDIRGDFSVDLKLGWLGGVADDKGKVQKGPFIALSPSGSSKRARATRTTQCVSCLVDSCMVDLSGCKEYHRRHWVCERHSKSPVVSIRGKEHRFCQQCSRFQSLAEFDEEKRSCRKRLDGHNRRRRKPQPEAFYMNNRSFLSNHQGTILLQFSCPEAYETRPGVPRHHPVSHYLATLLATTHNGADKCFPFLIANDPEMSNHHQLQSVPQVTIHSRLAHSRASVNANSHCTHSLLSLPCTISPSIQFGSRCTEARLVSLYPDDLLEKGASQVLPFSWK